MKGRTMGILVKMIRELIARGEPPTRIKFLLGIPKEFFDTFYSTAIYQHQKKVLSKRGYYVKVSETMC
jgi:hypothetical protein